MRICLLLGLAGLLTAGCSTVSAHLKRAEQLEQEQLYAEAMEELKAAAKEDPENPEPKIRLKKLQQRLADQACAEGRALLEMKDPWGAIEAFRRALEMDSESEEARAELNKTVAALVAEAAQQLADKKFVEASQLAEKLINLLPRHLEARKLREQVNLEWAKKLLGEAEEFMKKKMAGNALLRLAKMSQLVAVWGNSEELQSQARRQLMQDAAFCLSPQAGRIKPKLKAQQEKLLELVHNLKPEGCPAWSGAYSGCRRGQLQITLEGISSRQEKTQQEGEHKYQSGTRKVDNPKYLEVKDKLEKTRLHHQELGELIKSDEKLVEECRQAFADAGPSDDEESLRTKLKQAEADLEKHIQEQKEAEQQMRDLRAELKRLPAKVDEPVYDVFRYPSFTVTRTLQLKAKLVATGEGQLRSGEEAIEAEASTSDTSHPAYPKYKLEEDPLRFPESDQQLEEKLLGDAAHRIAGFVFRLCRERAEQMLSRARQALDDSPMDAAEDIVLYLFYTGDALPSDLAEFLKSHYQLSDPRLITGQEKPAGDQEPPASEKKPAAENGLEI